MRLVGAPARCVRSGMGTHTPGGLRPASDVPEQNPTELLATHPDAPKTHSSQSPSPRLRKPKKLPLIFFVLGVFIGSMTTLFIFLYTAAKNKILDNVVYLG